MPRRATLLGALLLLGCRSEHKISENPVSGVLAGQPDTGATPSTTTDPTGTDVTDTTGTDTLPPETTPPATDTGPTGTAVVPDTGLSGPEICETAANLAGYLDSYQTAGDGSVLYCHSQTGNKWVFIDANISACLPHIAHSYDIFPSTGCDS